MDAPVAQPTPPALPPSAELSPTERERHIADAVAEIDLAERAVEENLVKERTKPAPPRPPPRPPEPGAHERAQPTSEPQEGCARACLALGSMQSAVEHLCRLSGPTDARCRKAQLRLEDATRKVVAARCGCSPSR